MIAASDDLFEEWRLDRRLRAARQIERVNVINACFIRIINNRNPSARSGVVKNDRAHVEAALKILFSRFGNKLKSHIDVDVFNAHALALIASWMITTHANSWLFAVIFNDRKNAVVPMRRYDAFIDFNFFTRFARVRLRIVSEKVEQTAAYDVKHVAESAGAVFWQDFLNTMDMQRVDILKVANRRFSANIETMRLIVCFHNVNSCIIQQPADRSYQQP